MVTEPISPSRMEEELNIAGFEGNVLDSIVLDYIDYSVEGEDIATPRHQRERPPGGGKLIQYANRLR